MRIDRTIFGLLAVLVVIVGSTRAAGQEIEPWSWVVDLDGHRAYSTDVPAPPTSNAVTNITNGAGLYLLTTKGSYDLSSVGPRASVRVEGDSAILDLGDPPPYTTELGPWQTSEEAGASMSYTVRIHNKKWPVPWLDPLGSFAFVPCRVRLFGLAEGFAGPGGNADALSEVRAYGDIYEDAKGLVLWHGTGLVWYGAEVDVASLADPPNPPQPAAWDQKSFLSNELIYVRVERLFGGYEDISVSGRVSTQVGIAVGAYSDGSNPSWLTYGGRGNAWAYFDPTFEIDGDWSEYYDVEVSEGVALVPEPGRLLRVLAALLTLTTLRCSGWTAAPATTRSGGRPATSSGRGVS